MRKKLFFFIVFCLIPAYNPADLKIEAPRILPAGKQE